MFYGLKLICVRHSTDTGSVDQSVQQLQMESYDVNQISVHAAASSLGYGLIPLPDVALVLKLRDDREALASVRCVHGARGCVSLALAAYLQPDRISTPSRKFLLSSLFFHIERQSNAF
jgi:hypothetical protein